MYSAVVETKEQFNVVLNNDTINKIIISHDSFDEKDLEFYINKIKKNNKLAYIKLERISRYEKIKNLRKDTDTLLNLAGLDGIVICNLDSLYYAKKRIDHFKLNLNIDIDYSLNVYNSYSKKVINDIIGENVKFVTPMELNKPNIKEVIYDILVIYTYIPNMVSANCIYKNTNKCTKGKNIITNTNFFKDRMDKRIIFKTYCKYCYNRIFNFAPLILYDLKNNIKDININEYRYDFHFETAEEVKNVLNNTYNIKEFTRGYLNKPLK